MTSRARGGWLLCSVGVLCFTLGGCTFNRSRVYAEMNPTQVETILRAYVHVDMPQDDVRDALDRMKLPYVVRSDDEIVANVLPRSFFFTGPRWRESHPYARLELAFVQDMLASADLLRFEPGDEEGTWSVLTLADAPDEADDVTSEAGS